MKRLDSLSGAGEHGAGLRRLPAPGVAKPEGGENPERRGLRPGVAGRDPNDRVVDTGLGRTRQ